MSDIEDWLEAHEDDLAAIARELDISSSLIRSTAVFALVGMTDQEIHQQLLWLLHWLDGRSDPSAEAQRALNEIRRLIPLPPGTHDERSHLIFGHED